MIILGHKLFTAKEKEAKESCTHLKNLKFFGLSVSSSNHSDQDTHHHAQPRLGKSCKIVKENEKLLARQVERDQLVRAGDG